MLLLYGVSKVLEPLGPVLTACCSMSQALALVSDLKLGLYCKIPPKTMFFAQSAGTALGAVVNYSQLALLYCRPCD